MKCFVVITVEGSDGFSLDGGDYTEIDKIFMHEEDAEARVKELKISGEYKTVYVQTEEIIG
jgi:hypothetical protein